MSKVSLQMVNESCLRITISEDFTVTDVTTGISKADCMYSTLYRRSPRCEEGGGRRSRQPQRLDANSRNTEEINTSPDAQTREAPFKAEGVSNPVLVGIGSRPRSGTHWSW